MSSSPYHSDTKSLDKAELYEREERSDAGAAATATTAGDGAPNAAQISDARRKEVERKLVRKIDLRMSIMILIYIMNYMDRNNISAARLKGFQADLNLTDNQYQTCLSILYVGYILMQVPSNLFLNHIGKPSIYLPTAMMLWGLLSVLTGVVHNFTGAVLCRFFLGFVEAAFFPGALFLLSRWYTKKELALRTGILYLGNLSSNAFNGLIASGILSRFRWPYLFYIEGAITIGIAFAAIFILPDFPETTKWLSPEEKVIAQIRITEDLGEADINDSDTSAIRTFWNVICDYKVWLLTLILTAQVVGLSFNAFFPTLTKELGYNNTISLLLTAPPWAFACIVTAINGWHSDRTNEKFFHIIVSTFFGIIGCILGISTQNVAARYIGLFLMAQAYAGFVITFTWISSTLARPVARRAAGLAFCNAFSQLGNVAGSYVWPSKWAPYHNSFGICISCFGLSILTCAVLKWDLKRLNRKMDEAEAASNDGVHAAAVERAAKLEGVDVATAAARARGWRYLH